MDIVPQSFDYFYKQIYENLESQISDFIAPMNLNFSIFEYDKLCNALSSAMQNSVCQLIKQILEKKDKEFRNSPGRIERYYVKQTRPRTIITVFGEVTYTRTQYIDRNSKMPFCPVDRSIGLMPKLRYDACVQAKIYDGYADSNSMIKVGKIVGEQVFSHYSSNPARKDHAISRQTVYNILKRFNSINVELKQNENTPDTLYIMADEKYIPLQQRPEDQRAKPMKQMTKAVVIFEGIKPVINVDGTPSLRHVMTGKHHIASTSGNIWDTVLKDLGEKYDIGKIKKIYCMGDGAGWIVNGTDTIRGNGPLINYGIDRFHYYRAMHSLSKNETYRDLLRYYAEHEMQSDFNKMIKIIESIEGDYSDSQETNIKYLKRFWVAFQTMNKMIKIGCPMEQVISHVISSNFTSVPKAYAKDNLPRYLQARIHLKNGFDLRQLWLQAYDFKLSNDKKEEIIIRNSNYDFSIFDNNITTDTFHQRIFVNYFRR